MNTGGASEPSNISVQENDLVEGAKRVLEERNDAGLEGLVGNLDSVIIATEPDHLVPAVYDLLRYTGLSCTESFFDTESQSYVSESPRVTICYRTIANFPKKPFYSFNKAKMTGQPAQYKAGDICL